MSSSSGDARCLLRDPMFLPFPINNITKQDVLPTFDVANAKNIGFQADQGDTDPWIAIDLGTERVISSVTICEVDLVLQG